MVLENPINTRASVAQSSYRGKFFRLISPLRFTGKTSFTNYYEGNIGRPIMLPHAILYVVVVVVGVW